MSLYFHLHVAFIFEKFSYTKKKYLFINIIGFFSEVLDSFYIFTTIILHYLNLHENLTGLWN